MADTVARRRGYGEDAIYFDAAKNRFVGVISVGSGPDGKRVRPEVTGRIKTGVRDKLRAAHAELDRGLAHLGHLHGPACGDDWPEGGVQGWPGEGGPSTMKRSSRCWSMPALGACGS
jgi:hypothetical protein